MPDKANKLNIYLIKDGVPADAVMRAGIVGFLMDGLGTFYAEASHTNEPSWFGDFFGAGAASPVVLRVASAKGALVVSVPIGQSARMFVLVFGHGRFMLNESVIEERFGLKIVLNSVEPGSLRSIDKVTLGATPKQSREQMSRAGEASSFGIDIEQDLVNAVTGRSRYQRLGRTISGRDALAVSVKVDATGIRDFLVFCMGRYTSQEYKVEFDWIDQIKHVRDPSEASALLQTLVNKIAAKDLDKIWMAPPDILNWVDVKGFRYGLPRRKTIHDDLELDEFLATFADREITAEVLGSVMVEAISAGTEQPMDQWTALRCLYAEIDHNGQVYVLNDRRWYEIAAGFAQSVIDDFNDVPEAAVALIDYAHDNEGAYNVALSESLEGSFCLDANLIVHGGGHSRIEFCDVLTSDKKFVHVKRYSGSAQLSHLFAQGAVAGELFVQDVEFRQKLNDKLPTGHKLEDPAARPNPRDYEVVFAIVTEKPDLNIPFFSKVTMRNARRRLRGYGYSVTKKRIASPAAAAA